MLDPGDVGKTDAPLSELITGCLLVRGPREGKGLQDPPGGSVMVGGVSR